MGTKERIVVFAYCLLPIKSIKKAASESFFFFLNWGFFVSALGGVYWSAVIQRVKNATQTYKIKFENKKLCKYGRT